MPLRRSRTAALLLPLVMLLAVGLGQPATAQPAEAPSLDVVRAAYTILLDQFYRPLEGPPLLQAGWEALRTAFERERMTVPEPLGDLPADRNAAFDAFAARYAAVVGGLPSGVAPRDVAYLIVAGMADSLDEGHTTFLPPDNYQRFLGSLGANRLPVGLGFTVSPGLPRIVTDVIPNGPAERAGLRTGDVIVAVDGRDLRTATQSQYREAVSGEEGTARTLTVERDGGTQEISITHAPFYDPPLRSRVLEGRVGYIQLRSFTISGATLPDRTELLSDFDRRLDELDRAEVRGLILDLRNNSGGSVYTTTEILARFLAEDEMTVVRADGRGYTSTGLAGGHMRAKQLPMVVLVNGNSASASEVTASTLREANRALIVGSDTAGVLATAQVLPLPDGSGLQVALAEVRTARSGMVIDKQGFPVDIAVSGARTTEDYRTGRDPQLEAAVQALDRAPRPPARRTQMTDVSAGALRMALSRFMPDPAEIPVNARLTRVAQLGERSLTHPNQFINFVGPARDPLAAQRELRDLGYRGSYTQEYGVELLVPPGLVVQADLFATAEGARALLNSNAFDDLYERMPAPTKLGEATAAYRGVWMNQGAYVLQWVRGAVVFSVTYYDVPGMASMDPALDVARLVDGRWEAMQE